MNTYFNLTKEDLDLSEDIKGLCMGYYYIKNIDKMVLYKQCGGPIPLSTEQIYNYEETQDGIYVYVAYASGDLEDYVLLNGEKVSKESFSITKDNINNLHNLKYSFKKNDQGKYYISNIEKEQ